MDNYLADMELSLIERFNLQPSISLGEYLQARFSGNPVPDPAWDVIFSILAGQATQQQGEQMSNGPVQGIPGRASGQGEVRTARMAEHGMNAGITPAGERPL